MIASGSSCLLDADVFIQAKNQFYSFSICPGFWKALLWLHQQSQVLSIDRVHQELLDGKDELSDWVKAECPATFFAASSGEDIQKAYAEIMGWAWGDPQFFETAKADFARGADGWLVAYAKVEGLTVVTHETFDPNIRRKIKIPNACQRFGVKYMNTFDMLDNLKIQFQWLPVE